MSNSKKITQSALLLAIYFIIGYINILLGGMMIDFILPLPIIIITLRYGYKYGLIFYFCGLALFLPFNPFMAAYYSLALNGVGFCYGLLLRRSKYNEILLILSSAFIYFIASIITFSLIANLLGYPTDEIFKVFDQFLSWLKQIYQFEIADSKKDVLAWGFFIEFYLIFSLIFVYLVHQLGLIVLERLKITVFRATPILLLKLPRIMAFITMLILLSTALLYLLSQSLLGFVIFTIMLVLLLFLLFLFALNLMFYSGRILLRNEQKGVYFFLSLFLILMFPLAGIGGIYVALFKN